MRAECAMKFGKGEQRMEELARRCDHKEECIEGMRGWQNRAIGYAAAISTMISAGFAWLLKH
jgi:hypothetical protein